MRRAVPWALFIVPMLAAAARAAPLTVETHALLADPLDPTLVLAGTVRGVYRSTDGGVNWSRVGVANRNVLSLASSPADPSIVFAGTDGSGVYRSTDRGVTWATVALNGRRTPALASDPTNAQVVYAGTSNGLFKSTNGGTSFAASGSGISPPDILSLAVPPLASTTVYAGTDGGGAFRSVDMGVSWSARGLSTYKVTSFAIDPWDPLRLFAGTEGGGVLASSDAGATWTPRSTGLTNLDVLSVAIDPADPLTMYAGTKTGLFRSLDGGLTWTEHGTGTTEVFSIAFGPNGPIIASVGGASAPQGAPAEKVLGSGQWSNPAAWTPPGLPVASDLVAVVGAATLDQSATVRRLTVRSGGTLTFGSGHALNVSTGIVVTAGALQVTSTGGVLTAGGPMTVYSAGRLTLGGTSQARLRPGPGSMLVYGELQGRSAAATLTRSGPSGAIDMQIATGGRLDIDGLRHEHGDAEGLHVRAGATIARLRDARFEASAVAGGSYLTIESSALQLSAPGCRFGPTSGAPTGTSNVTLVDPAPGTTDDLAVTFEDRGPAISGVDAGPARSVVQGGAAANWVWACPDTTRGRLCGAPQVAWDQVSGADYAMYVAFSDIDAAGTDRIHVFDPAGNGVERSYWFDVPDGDGDLAGFPWWDTAPNGTHTLWATTTRGYAYLWVDTGAGAGAIAPEPGWPVRFVDAFTTPPVGDRTNIYAGGTVGGTPFIGGVDRASLTFVWAAYFSSPVRTLLSTEVRNGLNYVYGGSNVAVDGRARIYRVNVATQAVDLTDTTPTASVTAYPYVILGTGLYVGDLGGWLHGLDQATMLRKPNFPVQLSASPIEAGVFLDFVTDDNIYVGTQAGQLYRVTPTAATVAGWPIQPLGPAPIRGAPLVDAGVLWVSNADGHVGAIDASTRTSIEQWRFGAGAVPSELSQEFTAGRVVLTTSRGRFYVVEARPDPTP